MSAAQVSALAVFGAMRDDLAAASPKDDPYVTAVCKIHDDLANLLSWSEHALECISASKYPNTHAELRDAIARVKGGAA